MLMSMLGGGATIISTLKRVCAHVNAWRWHSDNLHLELCVCAYVNVCANVNAWRWHSHNLHVFLNHECVCLCQCFEVVQPQSLP